MRFFDFYTRAFLLIAHAGAVLFFAASGYAAQERTSAPSYRLSSGDEIKLTVFGEEDLSGTYKIDSAGMIALPFINTVMVSGLSAPEAGSLISEKLSDGYLVNPSVAVELLSARPIYIMGEVRRPGRYDHESDMNVLSAVALAGGFTYRANKSEVEIMQGQKGENAAYEDRPVESRVLPGDIILIKERFF